jgi:hypothetical protein
MELSINETALRAAITLAPGAPEPGVNGPAVKGIPEGSKIIRCISGDNSVQLTLSFIIQKNLSEDRFFLLGFTNPSNCLRVYVFPS